MKLLFDVGVPRPLAPLLKPHVVTEARALGWAEIRNGELIRTAEEAGFDVLVTNDKNIRYQQNLSSRKIALVVLGKTHWFSIRAAAPRIAKAVNDAGPGAYIEVDIPYVDVDDVSR